ncbi:MAG: phosphoserine phosphatase SerB [Salinirussus sp.]
MSIVAFDFDGTLSDSEMTVLLGKRIGAAAEMERITARAMNDEIDYATSLRERCALLDGLSIEDAEAAFDDVVLRPGAADVIRSLNAAGVHTAILTGGFERGVEAALERAGVAVDDIVANRLPVKDGALTGNVEGALVDGTKDAALEELADDKGVPLTETIAVGDGANDLPMLDIAGVAIGFAPKDAVAPACDVIVETMDELEAELRKRGVLEQ